RKWAELFHNHPGFGTERKFYVKVDRAVYFLAKSIWSKSTAREALVGYWLMLDKATRTKSIIKHPVFAVIDDMVPEKLRNHLK
ncbi:hypothetical protein GCK32_019434, partial [Trichostrongylus colubriformis]